jgi:hypothetical protein
LGADGDIDRIGEEGTKVEGFGSVGEAILVEMWIGLFSVANIVLDFTRELCSTRDDASTLDV